MLRQSDYIKYVTENIILKDREPRRRIPRVAEEGHPKVPVANVYKNTKQEDEERC